MLYDPQWEGRPSVSGFRAWLERQPLERLFPYSNHYKCPVGTYLLDCNTSWEELSANDGALLEVLNGCAFRAMRRAYGSMWISTAQVLREVEAE